MRDESDRQHWQSTFEHTTTTNVALFARSTRPTCNIPTTLANTQDFSCIRLDYSMGMTIKCIDIVFSMKALGMDILHI